MYMYCVCAAIQDRLIQDLVRGRLENLICFKIISEESKLRSPFPFSSHLFSHFIKSNTVCNYYVELSGK